MLFWPFRLLRAHWLIFCIYLIFLSTHPQYTFLVAHRNSRARCGLFSVHICWCSLVYPWICCRVPHSPIHLHNFFHEPGHSPCQSLKITMLDRSGSSIRGLLFDSKLFGGPFFDTHSIFSATGHRFRRPRIGPREVLCKYPILHPAASLLFAP